MGDPGCNASGGYHSTSATQSTKFTNPDITDNPATDTDESQVGAAIDLNGYSGICRYNYAYFDNVQEEQTNSQLWMEFNGEINNQNFHVEFAYGKTDVPQYATSLLTHQIILTQLMYQIFLPGCKNFILRSLLSKPF